VDFSKFTWGFYLNCGDAEMLKIHGFKDSGQLDSETEVHFLNDENFIKYVKERGILQLKPAFIGTCCMSDHKHTKKLSEFL
jgi:hypothetical protein